MYQSLTSPVRTVFDVHPSQVCVACGREGAREFLEGPDRFNSRRALYRLMRCPSCTLVWLEDPPRPEEMNDHYGPQYDAFISKASEGPEKRWQGAVETVRKHKSGGTLLDLGCGAGSFLKAFQNPSWTLYGIEMSEESASLARQRTGAEVFTGDILAAQYPAATFDAVTCFHVFEHVYSPAEVMARVWEWLKPGGIFYLHVPNIDAAEARLFRSFWYALELPRHLYHFSPTSLRAFGKSFGYEEAELVTQRVSFMEYSLRYICDDLLRKGGIERPSLAVAPPPSLAWRIFRKALRLTVLPLAAALISLFGDGEIVEVVFKKPE